MYICTVSYWQLCMLTPSRNVTSTSATTYSTFHCWARAPLHSPQMGMSDPHKSTRLFLPLLSFAIHIIGAVGDPLPWASDPVLLTIANRIISQQIISPYNAKGVDAEVNSYMSLLSGPTWNLSFSDVDYGNENRAFWSAMNHTVRLRTMTAALASPSSSFFGRYSLAFAAPSAFLFLSSSYVGLNVPCPPPAFLALRLSWNLQLIRFFLPLSPPLRPPPPFFPVKS